MRHLSLAVSTSSAIGVVAGRVESQYLLGSASPWGHSISSHSSACASDRLKSLEAGLRRTAAKRELSSALLPSRQATVRQASAGSASANALADIGL